MFILKDVFLSLLEFNKIEFRQILPIYSPMYNKHLKKEKNVGHQANLL